jgi:hypothetical protein
MGELSTPVVPGILDDLGVPDGLGADGFDSGAVLMLGAFQGGEFHHEATAGGQHTPPGR